MDKRKANFTLAFAMMSVVLLSSFAYLEIVSPVQAAASPYATVNGVLYSDYYSLYPYATKSLDIGISQYGELISTSGGTVGLQYPGYEVVGTTDQRLGTSADPFCNDAIAQNLWLNGWYIDIRYTHRTLRDRHIQAMAMYADMVTPGGNWLNGHALPLSTAPNGGRKTTAYAVTDPMQVLYNGPRSYIALCTTHLYDWYDANGNGIVEPALNETWPVVDVLMTFVFDKVSKEVVIYKDIKQIIAGKVLASPIDIQFSDREEWDLGKAPDYISYAHFYTQELSTVYNSDYNLAPGIFREYHYNSTGANVPFTVPVYDSRDPYGPPIANGSVRVYVNNVFWEDGVDYTIDLNTGVITWISSVLPADKVAVVYKLCKYMGRVVEDDPVVPYTGVPGEYDVAQIIGSDFKYVGWKAFWPVLSDYSVMGWSKSFEPLINVSQPDIATGEPDIPFVIGQWDFMLARGYPSQFRGVEVCGLTDRHDADDVNHAGSLFNTLDREAKYQLDMVFNPWDLVSAVHKKASDYIEFTTITAVGQTFITNSANVPVIVDPNPMTSYVDISTHAYPDYIPNPTEWDQYGVFSERIIANETSTPVLLQRGIDYNITQNSNGTATIKFYVTGDMKILYSVMGMYVATEGTNMGVLVGESSGPIQFNIFTDAFPTTPDELAPWFAKLKIHAFNVNSNSISGREQDAVYLNGHYCGLLTGTGDLLMTPTYLWTTSEFNVPPNYLNKTGQQLVQIFVSCTAQTFPETINPSDPTTWPTVGGNYVVEVDQGLLEFMPRYEWVVVGRDAKTVDSAGAALVSAAIKDKQVEIGIAGEDMNDSSPGGSNYIPFVFNKFGTGTTMADYEDTKGRTALIDDWCTTWPVARSDMISVGGPNVNLVAYYANDFEEAIYGIPQYTGYGPWAGAVAAISCWSKYGYYSNSSYGYAAVTTYMDINGTVVFNVWGVWGRDTYYACQFLQQELIYELEVFPKGVNSIILQINYKDPKHPTFSIPEMLGTISEHDLFESVKGGIHPDP